MENIIEKKRIARKVLMICYYYPPLLDVGAKRSIAFSKYFNKHGWIPYVISVKNPDKGFCKIGKTKAPKGITVEYSSSIVNISKILGKINGALAKCLKIFKIRINRNHLFDLFCIPDIFIGWIPLTFIKGLKLIRKRKIDFIYVSCSPFSSAITGILLRKITRKPLVLDFRDPYGLKIMASLLGLPAYRKRINIYVEKYILSKTDLLIVNTEETKIHYITQYPQVKDKIYAIHNGCDKRIKTNNYIKNKKFNIFTIVYAGEFYLYALKSKIFFEAIRLLKYREKVDQNTFRFLYFGDSKDEIAEIAKDYNISELVQSSNRIPFNDMIKIICESQLQLLRIMKPMISTKLIEGIPLNTPFIAIIPHGESEEIIKKYSPSSYIITNNSAEDVYSSIIDAIEKYKKDEIKENKITEFLTTFDRDNLAKKLIHIIEAKLYKNKPGK